jgi:hypothetical protein
MSPTMMFSMGGFLLEFSAEDGVKAADEEDARGDGDEDQVSHGAPPWW